MPHRQQGLTLIELMLSLAIGLLVVLAATALLQHARAGYQDLDDAGRVQETGRMALSHLAGALRQAGHLPWESVRDQPAVVAALPPGLGGADDHRGKDAGDPGSFHPGAGDGFNNSDLLMIGLSGVPRGAGGEVINCSGGDIPAMPPQGGERHWVSYLIDVGQGGEPELRCRHRGKNGGWTSQAIARGVEAMQLRYALDADGDGHPEDWRNASQLSADDWRRVKLVRIALLVRGDTRRPVPVGATPRTYDLFSDAADDPAWRFTEPRREQRLRAVFQTTVFLRNGEP